MNTDMLSDFLTLLHGWSIWNVILRIVTSVVIGTAIGIDREYKNRSAGIKTHVLVCIGSALCMIVSEYIFHQFPDARADMARIGAQVVSGVGFLGVGTIITTGRNEVKGLSTAAGLWTSACCGLAAGIGYIEGALLVLLFVVFTFRVLSRADAEIHKKSRSISLYIEFRNNSGVRAFIQQLRDSRLKFSNFSLQKSAIKGEGPIATIDIRLPSAGMKEMLFDYLQNANYILYFDGLDGD